MYTATISPTKSEELHGVVPPFLVSLHDMLIHENPSVIGWCSDGKSFAVHDNDALATKILPTYFRHSRIASFQRQLNYHGFRKHQKALYSDDGSSTYSSPHFIRDDPKRMLLIKRKTYRPKDRKLSKKIAREFPRSISMIPTDKGFLTLLTEGITLPKSIECMNPIPFHSIPHDTWSLSTDDLALLASLTA